MTTQTRGRYRRNAKGTWFRQDRNNIWRPAAAPRWTWLLATVGAFALFVVLALAATAAFAESPEHDRTPGVMSPFTPKPVVTFTPRPRPSQPVIVTPLITPKPVMTPTVPRRPRPSQPVVTPPSPKPVVTPDPVMPTAVPAGE